MSSPLKKQIQSDLITAIKSRDAVKTSVLRMLKADITKLEVSGEKKEVNDEDIIELVQKQIKQRYDAEKQYNDGGRPELAEKEAKEAEVLKEYLPPQLSEKEIRDIVQKAINDTGASSKADMGKVMGAVMPEVKGKSDGNLVKDVVMELLP